MVVFLALERDLVRQFLEVAHDKGIKHLHVLVVLSCQVVFHQPDFLTEQVDLLLVVPHDVLAVLNVVLAISNL